MWPVNTCLMLPREPATGRNCSARQDRQHRLLESNSIVRLSTLPSKCAPPLTVSGGAHLLGKVDSRTIEFDSNNRCCLSCRAEQFRPVAGSRGNIKHVFTGHMFEGETITA